MGSSPVDVSPFLTVGAIGDDVAMGLFTAAQSADSLAGWSLAASTRTTLNLRTQSARIHTEGKSSGGTLRTRFDACSQ